MRNNKTYCRQWSIAGGLKETKKQQVAAKRWKNFSIPKILFEDKAPQSQGSKIYHALIPNPTAYINKVAREVLNTLYYSEKDSIPAFNVLHYTLEDVDGVSAKGGGNGNVSIFYSTRHIQKSFANNDTARVDFETRGVLLHELTHAFQLEPHGIGSYGTNKTIGALLKEWPMLFVWPTMVSMASKIDLRAVAIKMDIAIQAISWLGYSKPKTPTSCASLTALQSSWKHGRGMQPYKNV